MKKRILFLFIFLIAIGIGIWIWSSKSSDPDGSAESGVDCNCEKCEECTECEDCKECKECEKCEKCEECEDCPAPITCPPEKVCDECKAGEISCPPEKTCPAPITCPTGSYYSDGNMGLRKINQYAQVYNERATFPEPRGDGWSRARNTAGEYHLSCAPNSYYGNFENNGKQYSYCVLPPN